METKKVLLAAHVDEDSELHRAIVKEQERTQQSVAAILRDALAIRYALKINTKEPGQ